MELLLLSLFSFIQYAESIHIVFVLADDLGFGDLAFTNGISTVKTPTISELSSKGIILNNYYVQPICTPTRAALMSGRYPIHVGLQHGVIKDSVPDALPLSINNKNVTLLPQYLKQHSTSTSKWHTHIIGKWHLGFYHRIYTPQERGFDTYYGYYTGNEEYWNHTSPCWNCGNFTALDLGWHNITTDIFDFNQSGFYSTELFALKAQQVIKTFATTSNNNDNLFLYLPFEAVHCAASCDPNCEHPSGCYLQAPTKYINEQSQINNMDRRTYGGMLGALDDAINNITNTLKEYNLWNETLFIFSSDNGAPASKFNGQAMSNYPLRGQKAQLWEGGVRAASFVYSEIFMKDQNKYKTGYRYDGLMHVTDWYTTIAGILDDSVKTLPDLDGYNMWDALINNLTSPRNEILINIDPITNYSAIRSGKYKLLQGMNPGKWYPVYNGTYNENTEDNIYLFDIEIDPTEHNNIAANNSDIVKQLQNKIEQYRKNMLPAQNSNPDPNAANLILAKGVWYSWQDE